MPQVGDTDLLEVDVYPFDNTTVASFTVVHPDGNSTSHSATPSEVQAELNVDGTVQTVTVQRWTSGNLAYDAARQWVIVAVVTGTGAGVQPRTVWVDALPTGGGVEWRPNLARVAAYVQRRTLVEADDGYGNIRRMFDDTTHPSADVVDLLIADGVRWVSDRTGALDVTLYESGTGLAARWTAAHVLLNYPDNDADLRTAEILLRQLDVELKALAARNENLTGDDPDDPDGVFEVAPTWEFPCLETRANYVW